MEGLKKGIRGRLKVEGESCFVRKVGGGGGRL